MKRPWCRLYAEFAFDPKVQSMSETLQRRFIMLMCLKCNGDETLHETELCFAMRVSAEELAHTKEIFLAKKFINDDWNLLNWESRQFISDSSTKRVQDFRNKNKKQKRNVSVTSPDTETDTDKKNKTKKDFPEFETFWEAYPRQRRGNREKTEAAYRQALSRSSAEKILSGLKSYTQSAEVKQGFAKGAAAWLNDDRWENDYSIIPQTGTYNAKPTEPRKANVITL